MELELVASFGDQVPYESVRNEDMLTFADFSNDGNYLATSDQSGRVCLFHFGETVSFLSQVNAHRPKFDIFRSELSAMKIEALAFVPRAEFNESIITCNSREAKIWSFADDSRPKWTFSRPASLDQFVCPSVASKEAKFLFTEKSTIIDADLEYLISVACFPQADSFLLTDINTIKLYDFETEKNLILYRVCKETEMEVTATHIISQDLIAVGNEGGAVKILDRRQQATDLTASMTLNTSTFQHQSSTQSSLISSLGSYHEYIFSRTYGEMQVWDLRFGQKPFKNLDVQWFPGEMEELAQDDNTHDSFHSCFTRDGMVLTGMYSANFQSWDVLQDAVRKHTAISQKMQKPPPECGKDFGRRVACCKAHPKEDLYAILYSGALFIYQSA